MKPGDPVVDITCPKCKTECVWLHGQMHDSGSGKLRTAWVMVEAESVDLSTLVRDEQGHPAMIATHQTHTTERCEVASAA